MRVMVLVKATKDSEAGVMPTQTLLAEMGKFNEELMKAGIMLAGDGLRLEHLTLAEQNEVVRRLTERGKSIRDIADQLATTKRTVSRRRLAAHAA